jgi:hypothetical protein
MWPPPSVRLRKQGCTGGSPAIPIAAVRNPRPRLAEVGTRSTDRVCVQCPRARSRVQPGTIVLLRTWNGGSLRERRGCRARRFGHNDPRAVILDVAFEYFRAPKSGAGRRACRLLTSRERARLARREASGCAATINKELGRRLIKGRETVAEVVSMNPKLGTASATVVKMSIRGKPPVIRLRHEHHAWRIVDTHL